jgi:two-component system response regulator HupR/HoxA
MKVELDTETALDTVLIVDDDLMARDTLAAILSDTYYVDTADSTDQALRLLARGRYAVLISDYEMPGGSGLELLKRLEDTHPDVIAILLTAHADKRDVREADRARRVFAVLKKPYDPQDLIRSLRLAMATARMRRLCSSSSGKYKNLGKQL